MKLLFTSSLVTITLLLGACSKEGENSVPMLTGRYQTEQTIKAGPLQLYTASGVITAPATITRFLRQHRSSASGYFLSRDSTLAASNPVTFRFQDNNRVSITASLPGGGSAQTREEEVISRTANRYLLAAFDSVRVIEQSRGPAYVPTCDAMPQKIREHQPAKRCRPIPFTAGLGNLSCGFRPLRVLALRNGQPVLPLMSWLATASRNGSSCGLAYQLEPNTVSPTLSQNLAAGDTVLVQVNELPLRKQ